MNWLRRILGGRPVLRLHVMRGNELSEFVTRQMRRDAETRGYKVKERRL